MNPQDQLLDALETVLSWELPDEYLADVLSDQTSLMAGSDPKDSWDCPSESIFS